VIRGSSLAFLAIVALAARPRDAHACSPEKIETPEELVANSESIVIARALRESPGLVRQEDRVGFLGPEGVDFYIQFGKLAGCQLRC